MKYAITSVLLILSVSLNSKNNMNRLTEFGKYNTITYNKSVEYSSPIYSPIPIRALKKRSFKDCSNIGYRKHPIFKTLKNHNGIDLPAEIGTEVISTMHGEVTFASMTESGYGKKIVIEGPNWKLIFAHLSKIDVKTGDKVSFGQKIGEVGNTGFSTGPHLHYEIYQKGNKYKRMNPLGFITGDYYK